MNHVATMYGAFRGIRQVLSVLCLIAIVFASFQPSSPAFADDSTDVQISNFSPDTADGIKICATCGVVPSGAHCAHADNAASTLVSADAKISSGLSGSAVFSTRYRHAFLDVYPSVHGEPPKA